MGLNTPLMTAAGTIWRFPNPVSHVRALPTASWLIRLKELTALLDTLHSKGMTRRSWTRITRSARMFPSLLSPQNTPGAGAVSSRVMSRGGISEKPMSRSKALTASSCALFASDRRNVSTLRAAASTAEAVTAYKRSCSRGSRCSPIQENRWGSSTCRTTSRTRWACSASSRKAVAESVVSARIFRSSSEIGGAARYRKAMRLLRSAIKSAISAGSSEPSARDGSRSIMASKTGTNSSKNRE